MALPDLGRIDAVLAEIVGLMERRPALHLAPCQLSARVGGHDLQLASTRKAQLPEI